MAELRPKVFREPELLEAVSEVLTGRGAKTTIQSSGGREEPCIAQAAACAILAAALKVQCFELNHSVRNLKDRYHIHINSQMSLTLTNILI